MSRWVIWFLRNLSQTYSKHWVFDSYTGVRRWNTALLSLQPAASNNCNACRKISLIKQQWSGERSRAVMLAKPDLLMRVRLIKFTPLFWSDNVLQFLWVTCYHVKEVSCTYEQAFKVTEQTVEVFPCSYNCPTVWLLLWPGLSCKRDSKYKKYIDICSDTEDETYCSYCTVYLLFRHCYELDGLGV